MSDNDVSTDKKLAADIAWKYLAVASLATVVLALTVNAPALYSGQIPAGLGELELPPVRALRLPPLFGAILAWLANGAAGALVVVLVTRMSGSLYAGVGAGLIFAVHPVHVEAVSWSDARAVPVAAALALGSCLIWFWDRSSNIGAGEGGTSRPWRIAAQAAALVMLAAAGYLVPTMAAMPICIWAGSALRGRIRGQGFQVRGHWPMLLVAGIMIVFRQGLPRLAQHSQLDGFAAWVDAMGSLVVPWRILPDYRPLYDDPGPGLIAYGFVGMIALIVLARRLKVFRTFRGGFSWLFLTFIFSLSVDHVYRADWALYIGSIGFVWVAGEALALLSLRAWRVGIAAVVILLAGRTIAHHGAWADSASVLQALEQLPASYHGEIGRKYAILGETLEMRARVLEHDASRLETESRTDLAEQKRLEAADLRMTSSSVMSRAGAAVARAEVAVGRDAPAILAARGEVAYRGGDYLTAKEAFTRAIAAGVSHGVKSQLLVLLGEIAARSGNIAEATKRYEEAVGADRANAEAHFKLGAAMLAADRSQEAVEEFRQAALLKPEDPAFQNALGRVFERMLRFEDAEAAYLKTVRLSPDREDYRLDLEAVRAMMKGRETDPDAAKEAFARGVLLEKQSRFVEASQAYREAVTHVTGYHDAYYRAGLCMAAYGARLKKYDEMRHYLEQAVLYFTAALTHRSRHEPYLFALAQAHSDLGHVSKAVELLKVALQINPRSGLAHYKLARIYAYALEDVPLAREHLAHAEALGVVPAAEFVSNLDEIEAELSAPPKTEEEERAEETANAADSEGDVLAQMSDAQGAAGAYARAYEVLREYSRPGMITARARSAWNAGRAWERAKDLPKALEWYLRAIEDRPGDAQYLDDVRRLKALLETPTRNDSDPH
jgi:tetratricopeptide (TPR) repeat protein